MGRDNKKSYAAALNKQTKAVKKSAEITSNYKRTRQSQRVSRSAGRGRGRGGRGIY